MPGAVTSPARKPKTRVVAYVIAALVIAAVIAVAYYQEQLGYFFALRAWDPAAPGRAVVSFLKAGKQGDVKQADSYIGANDIKPLDENGKRVGYFIATPAGVLEYRFDELASGDPRPARSELIYRGSGAAEVYVPDSKGKEVKYRLEMRDGGWKITEILGGRTR